MQMNLELRVLNPCRGNKGQNQSLSLSLSFSLSLSLSLSLSHTHTHTHTHTEETAFDCVSPHLQGTL